MSLFYPTICWVPKDSFALLPKRAAQNSDYQQILAKELKKKELESDSAPQQQETQNSDEDEEAARIAREYNLDDYDNDDDRQDGDASMDDEENLSDAAANDEDGSIVEDPQQEADEDEDYALQPSDNLLLVAEVNQAQCIAQAQVHVYNEPNKQYYLHHDFYLDSLPLCFEWIGGGDRNLLAIGRMEAGIQLWDLDVVDSLTYLAEFGAVKKSKAKKNKKKNKKAGATAGQSTAAAAAAADTVGHTDAVLDLAWNRISQQALASASADNRIGLWDLQSHSCVQMLQNHTDKAQTVSWHPAEAEILLSGGYDHRAVLADCRQQQAAPIQWRLDGECERVLWEPRNPLYFYCSTDCGTVHKCDVRSPGDAVQKLLAHSGGCSGLGISEHWLCTAGADGMVKLWRVDQNQQYRLLTERDWQIGEATRLVVNPNCDLVLAVTGTEGFQVWDTREDAQVRAYLSSHGIPLPEA